MRVWEPSLCHYLCVKGRGKLSSLPSSVFRFSLLVLLSCCRAHFLVPYNVLTARHCAEIETAQFLVSCWGSERWRQLQVIYLINLCLVSSTRVANNPLGGCCYENHPLMSPCKIHMTSSRCREGRESTDWLCWASCCFKRNKFKYLCKTS